MRSESRIGAWLRPRTHGNAWTGALGRSAGVELLLYLSLLACVAAVLAGHELALLGLVGGLVTAMGRA